MANMHLVTGYAGKEHVTAADHGSFYAALISSGSFVLDKGNKLAINKISNNTVRVLDGDVLMQGRHCRVADAAFVDLAVESGQNGYKRRDLVCVRYLRDADTGVEDCNLIVLRGDPVAASPADPEYVTGDIIGGALQNDFPLYRLNLNGTEIESIDTLFAVFPSIENKRTAIDAELLSVWAKFADYDSGIPKIAYGRYVGTAADSDTVSYSTITIPTGIKARLLIFFDMKGVSGSNNDKTMADIAQIYGYPCTSFYSNQTQTVTWGNDSVTITNWASTLNKKTETYLWFAIGE